MGSGNAGNIIQCLSLDKESFHYLRREFYDFTRWVLASELDLEDGVVNRPELSRRINACHIYWFKSSV